MPTKLLTTDELVAMLREGPRRINAAAKGVSPKRLVAKPAPDEWSANEILAHLRSCADVWGGSIAEIVKTDHPTIRGVNPRHYIKTTDYAEQDFHEALRAFIAQRKRLLSKLASLSAEDWDRQATITGAGKPLVLTIHSYVDRLARHERPHLKQIERTLAQGS